MKRLVLLSVLLFVLRFARGLVLEAQNNLGQSEITCAGDQEYNYGACCGGNINIPNYVYQVRKSDLTERNRLQLFTNPNALIYDAERKILLVMVASCCDDHTRGIQVVDTVSWKITANISLQWGYYTQWGSVRYDPEHRTIWATNHLDFSQTYASQQVEVENITLNEEFTNATQSFVSCSSSSLSCTFLMQYLQVGFLSNAIYVAGYNLEYGTYVRSEVVKINPFNGAPMAFQQYQNYNYSAAVLYATETSQGTLVLTVSVNGSQISLNQLDPDTLHITRSLDISNMIYVGYNYDYYAQFAFDEKSNTLFMIAPIIGQLDLDSFSFVATLNLTSIFPKREYAIWGVDADWATSTLYILGYSGDSLSVWLKVGFSTNAKPTVALPKTDVVTEPYWLITGGAYETGSYASINLIDPTGSVDYTISPPYLYAPTYGSNGITINSWYYAASCSSGCYLLQYSQTQFYQYNKTYDQLSSFAQDTQTGIVYCLLSNANGVYQYNLTTFEAGKPIYENTNFSLGDQIAIDSDARIMYVSVVGENATIIQVNLDTNEYMEYIGGTYPITQMLVSPSGQLIVVQETKRPGLYNGIFEIAFVDFGDSTYTTECFSTCAFNASSVMLTWDLHQKNIIAVIAVSSISSGYFSWRYQMITFDPNGQLFGEPIYIHENMYTQLYGLAIMPYYNLCGSNNS